MVGQLRGEAGEDGNYVPSSTVNVEVMTRRYMHTFSILHFHNSLPPCHIITLHCTTVDYKRYLYRRESNLAISSSPVTKRQCVYLVRRTAIVWYMKISSSAPGLSLMTHREYRVDRPFPDM